MSNLNYYESVLDLAYHSNSDKLHKKVWSKLEKLSGEFTGTRQFLFKHQDDKALIRTPVDLSRLALVSKKVSAPASGADFNFELMASPVINYRDDDNVKKQKPITDKDELHQWFERKAQQSGFEYDPAALIATRCASHYAKKSKAGAHDFSLNRIDFSGRLRVTDSALFYKALTQGIGKGRAYGFGLLMIF